MEKLDKLHKLGILLFKLFIEIKLKTLAPIEMFIVLVLENSEHFSIDLNSYKCLTLSVPTLWNTSPVPGGGQICPPLNYGYGRMFSLFLLARVLNLDVKGQNLKAQPST